MKRTMRSGVLMTLILQNASGLPAWLNPCAADIRRCDPAVRPSQKKRGIEECLTSLPSHDLSTMCRVFMMAAAAGEHTIPTHDASTTAAASTAASLAAEAHRLHHQLKAQSSPPPTLSLPLLLLLLAVLPLLVRSSLERRGI